MRLLKSPTMFLLLNVTKETEDMLKRMNPGDIISHCEKVRQAITYSVGRRNQTDICTLSFDIQKAAPDECHLKTSRASVGSIL